MQLKGTVRAVCVSSARGTAKRPVERALLVKDHGIEGDAHAGKWHRQISLLSYEQVAAFNRRGGDVADGDFGENLLVEGIDLARLSVGTVLKIGPAALRVTQIGKECHNHCAIRRRVGDCIMPREGVFAEVVEGGEIQAGDAIEVSLPVGAMSSSPVPPVGAMSSSPVPPVGAMSPSPASSVGAMSSSPASPFTAAVITLSDKGAAGERPDESGPAAVEMLEAAGYRVVEALLLSDEPEPLKAALCRLADERRVDLVITSGGTGFSPRDFTPEATLAVADRNAPGIAEYIRMRSMEITPRAMLGRGVSVIRGHTLIVNLPGSPRAVRESLGFILDALPHGLEVLRGTAGDCGAAP